MTRPAQRVFGSKSPIQNRELRHKLYAEGTVEVDAPEVLAVPRTAVLWPGNNPRVYVEQQPGAYQQRRVILGRAGDDFWEILEGLKEGERVVTSGNMLIDGQAQLSNVGAPSDESPPLHDPAMEMNAAEHEALETLPASRCGSFRHACARRSRCVQRSVGEAAGAAAGFPGRCEKAGGSCTGSADGTKRVPPLERSGRGLRDARARALSETESLPLSNERQGRQRHSEERKMDSVLSQPAQSLSWEEKCWNAALR